MDAQQFGPYRLEALIGAGGMGEVFRAYDTRRHRSVAVKLLPEALSNDRLYQRRFRREAHLAAGLREPHIIPIHDFGEIAGRLFIDMRLVDGESIQSILEKHGPIAPERAVHLIGQVAEALDAAHSNGLVHRDIKPSNILVTTADFVYVVDFGVARSIGANSTILTRSDTTVGTLDYMAPERFETHRIDARSDIYSLTCLLYECLTACQPFPGRHDLPSLMYAHVFTPPPHPTESNPEVAKEFDAVIAKGMAKDPGARFSTAIGVADAARTALSGTPPDVGAGEPAAVAGGSRASKATAHAPPSRPEWREPTAAAAATSPWNPTKDDSAAEPPARRATPTDATTRAEAVHVEAGAAPPPLRSGPPSGAGPGRQWQQWRQWRPWRQWRQWRPWSLGRWSLGRPWRQGRRGAALTAAAAVAVVILLVGLIVVIVDPPGFLDTAPPVAASADEPVTAATIPVGAQPGFVAATPDGRHVYTANRGDNSLSVIDATRDAVTTTVPVPVGQPRFLTFTPDGSQAYLSIYDPARNASFIGVLDTGSNTISATARVGNSPFAIAVAPDGEHVYVGEHDSGTVHVVDTASNTVVATVPVPPNPHSITISHDGETAYIANYDSDEVSVLDTASNSVTATVPAGIGPHSVAITPDQSKVAAANYGENTVSIIDTARNSVIATVPVGTHPQDVAFAPDGQHAYVANSKDDTVSVISLRTNQVTATIPAGERPARVAVLPNGRQAYVGNLDSGNVTVLDTAK